MVISQPNTVTNESATSLLRQIGRRPDADIDLAVAALALAALAQPGTDLAPYNQHLHVLAEEVAADVRARAGREPKLIDRIDALNSVLFDRHGYQGDRLTYNDLQNADLIRVIDRRRGLPIALAILYIHAGRAQGWAIEGVNFPGHFLVRLRRGDQAAIVDPFDAGTMRDTAALRQLLKSLQGEDAELAPEYCQVAGNRLILLRLQNNIKLRLLRDGKHEEALGVVQRMQLVAPEEPGLWYEAGILHGRLGNMRAAIAALENLVALSRDDEQKAAAAQLIAEMKTRLN
jgi:regulator of sirC expression with transglutaminase-like and TPR domain